MGLAGEVALLSRFGVWHRDLMQTLCKQPDRTVQVVAPSGQAGRKYGVSRIRPVENANTFLFGANIDVENVNAALEVIYHALNHSDLS